MGGAPKASRLVRFDQSHRDVTYLRLAFRDFPKPASTILIVHMLPMPHNA